LRVVIPQYPVTLNLGRFLLASLSFLALSGNVLAQQTNPQDSTARPYQSSRRPTYRVSDRYGDPFSNTTTVSPLFLKDPNQMKLDVEIDTALNYTIFEKIGNINYRPTSSMSFDEFKQYQERLILKSYWQGRSRAQDGESAVSGRGFVPKIYLSPVFDRIFGGSYIELIPRGFVTLDFGASFQRINNPTLPIRQQRNGGFEFDQQINMSVVGKIGEKLAVTANFDNNNSFDFQNNMKVEYTGFKEDILQKFEIGNVSLPLNNTLIQGAQNLFGLKAQMQFGKMMVTSIATTQRGKTSSIDVGGGGPGGGQGRPFQIIGSNYDDNRHFFLSHFFRDNYRNWLVGIPQIISGVNITRVEVYVLNRNNDTQTLRNVVGLMDLAEGRRIYNPKVVGNPNFPASNNANNLKDVLKWTPAQRNPDGVNQELENAYGMENGTDFEKITGSRKLAPTEFTYHPQLGYITLTRKLQNDEVLAVAYEYTYTYTGKSYKVGEMSEDYASRGEDEVIFLKLLRPRKVAVRDKFRRILPTWELMMKNIYTLNVNQLTRENFQLRVIYRDDRTGIDNPQLQDGSARLRERQLIEVMGLDRLNPVNDPGQDGNFDFVDNITINTQNGLIIFPYLHPFSDALREAFDGESREDFLNQKYSFDTLYNTTKADAELFATKNKFWLMGTYNAGSSKEILIPGFGVSQGSVKLFAGGIQLAEGTDYVVDYTFGKVTILNESILNSGKNIEVQFEQSDPFAFQTRSLLGTRLDYRVSDDVNLGSTFLYYNERPLVSRNQIGTEPARNIQYGLDFNVNKKSRFLTKIVDALPFLETKEASTVNLTGEFAQLIPGTSNVIDGEGTAYIDDFETSATPYSLMSPAAWKLAATPRTPNHDYEPISRGALNNIHVNDLRAKIAWYQVDNQFYRDGGPTKPENVTSDDLKNHYVRSVWPQEIFPNRQLNQAVFYEQIFDVAFYPQERGPYNYAMLDGDGLLPKAKIKENWGGITTAIRTEVDFDKANIEYVEFWLLDPFINTKYGYVDDGRSPTPRPNTTGGKLIFQLGTLSEDVTRDAKHGFENGLPPNGALDTDAIKTEFGYVTNQQYLTNGFDADEATRLNQDVGFDGLPTSKEIEFFGDYINTLPSGAQTVVRQDPSADNFRHFFDSEYDNDDAQILERYKAYNGHDGNTPVTSADDLYARSGSTIPENEDLNADNTLNELEEYYEYDMDLGPGLLDIGKEYIVDKITTNDPQGQQLEESVTWYLFRIPVREFERQYGNIEGFKSVRYVRMVLTDFEEPVVLRMANFRLVGSRWRRFTDNLLEGGLIPTPEPTTDDFMVSVVNLEENGAASPTKSPYMIPPGVVRDRDVSSSVPRQLNEQSIQLCADDLKDGDARAMYKNLSMDLFNYGHIKMYFHADSEAPDDELYGFIRLGTDFDLNFYEIEIPLKVTDNPGTVTDEREVWPLENEIDLDLNELYKLKIERDRDGRSLSQFYPVSGPRVVGRHRIRVFGRPDLTSMQVIMIGVRNPKSPNGQSYPVCIWANELRVTDFNRTAGWAVNSTLNAKLADLATINGAFRYTSFGFGSISSKIFERTREETTAYGVSATVNVDKLLPGNTGIKIPMFIGYENTVAKPLYDPANPDLRLDNVLQFLGEEERKEYLAVVRDQRVSRSLNFINVRKEKVNPEARSHLWDVENLSFSYSYNENTHSNFNLAEETMKQQKGSAAYTFSPKTQGIEPFKKGKAFSGSWFKLIKDFNLNLIPNNIGVRFDLDRSFTKNVYRNEGLNGEFKNSQPNYMKYFTFMRQYNLRWELSKNLTLEYNARASAIVDEPEGELDTQEKIDSVMNNLKALGRMKAFDQNIILNYALPLDKLPLTNWLSADYRYQVAYNWKAGPVNHDDRLRLYGDLPDSLNFYNTIQNTRDQNFTGKIDLVKLYNKVKFLKELNTPKKPVRPTSTNPRVQRPPAKADTVKQPAPMPGLMKGIFRLLMMVRSVNGSYTLTEGTLLPGFIPTPKYFGMDKGWGAPGWSFVLGGQDPNIRYEAASKGWITTNSTLTTPFTQLRNENINLRANVEPSPDFKIQLDMKKETTNMFQSIFRDTLSGDGVVFADMNPSRSGSYRISTALINTSFKSSNDDLVSEVFQQFEKNIDIIRNRFQPVNGVEYDTAQDVLIPAFVAAYTGRNAQTISLSPFPKTPLPNWRIDYTGLNKIGMFKNMFQSITITHAYQSTYSVVNYSNSLEFSNPDDLSIDRDISDYNRTYFGGITSEGALAPVYIISQVLLSEQFSPLIGINMRTKGRLSANFQYKTKRDLALNISNAQITELNNKDVSFELGYTKNNMKLPFKNQGRTIVLKNDVTFRLNMTIGNTKTIQRKIDERNMVTAGNINFQLRPNISYVVNQKLNIQLYFERTINEPLITSTPRRATTRFGTQIRFSLAQ